MSGISIQGKVQGGLVETLRRDHTVYSVRQASWLILQARIAAELLNTAGARFPDAFALRS